MRARAPQLDGSGRRTRRGHRPSERLGAAQTYKNATRGFELPRNSLFPARATVAKGDRGDEPDVVLGRDPEGAFWTHSKGHLTPRRWRIALRHHHKQRGHENRDSSGGIAERACDLADHKRWVNHCGRFFSQRGIYDGTFSHRPKLTTCRTIFISFK